jgi:uncharacterized protein (DUF885 family)
VATQVGDERFDDLLTDLSAEFAEGRRGARFPLADCHDEVLALGPLPPSVLEAELEQDDG